jgi:hypothetical protein
MMTTVNSESEMLGVPPRQERVSLVLDTCSGPTLEALARRGPVWILTSPDNDRTAESVRLSLGTQSSITILLQVRAETKQATLTRALYAIDEHHGKASGKAYREIAIYGAAPELLDPEIARDLRLSSVEVTDFGFLASI